MPVDVIPDFLVVAGYTDDASVMLAAIAAVAAHIRPDHRRKAADALKNLGR